MKSAMSMLVEQKELILQIKEAYLFKKLVLSQQDLNFVWRCAQSSRPVNMLSLDRLKQITSRIERECIL